MTGPFYWTQTIKWMDASGNARLRWQRLLPDEPFAAWDAEDGDGPQAWNFQEFNCPNISSGLSSGQVIIEVPNTPTVRAVIENALAEQWLVDVRHYRLTNSMRLYGSFLGAVRGVSGDLINLSISAESSPPPVVATIPPRITTTELIGTPCRLSFS